jgi:hypothetical protein
VTAIRVCPEATILSRSVAEAQYPHARVAAWAGRRGWLPMLRSAHENWDNLNTHVSAVMREFTGAHPDWLTVIQLPAHAQLTPPI